MTEVERLTEELAKALEEIKRLNSPELTVREKEVMDLILADTSTIDAADKLCITVKCVKYHLTRIYKKENVKNRYELRIKHGWPEARSRAIYKDIDLIGKTFGKLTVICKADKNVYGRRTYWHCSCDCGGKTMLETYVIMGGMTKSCGCLKRGKPKPRTKIYRTDKPTAESVELVKGHVSLWERT